MTTLKLFNADCLEQMKSIPDNSIDLIICDLPYGCLTGGGGEEKKRKRFINGVDTGTEIKQTEGVIAGCSWDIKLDLVAFWKQIKRIRKDDHTPCLHFCSTKFGYELIKSNEKEFRYELVWNKMRGVGFLSANKKPMAAHEMIYVFSKKGCYYNRIDVSVEPYLKKSKNEGTSCVISVIEQYNTAGHGGKQHPTAKPIELYKWLISRYSNEGDTVLDPTFGSANSGVVCQELKRNYIGIEMNKEFYDKAEKSLVNIK